MKREQLGNAAWGFRETPLARQLEVTKNLGLCRLEFSIASTPKDFLQIGAGDKEVAAAAALFKKFGIPLTEASIGNDFGQADDARNREAVDVAKKKIDLAGKLGVKSMRIFSSFAPAKDMEGKRLASMVQALNLAAAHAQSFGITLAVETHGGVRKVGEDRFIHSPSVSTEPERVATWLPDCAPNLGLNYDPANLWAAGTQDVLEFYERFKKRVVYAHLKDYLVEDRASRTVRPVGCGEGVLDWKALMACMGGYEGPVFIEYEPASDVEDGCRRSAEFMAAFLEG